MSDYTLSSSQGIVDAVTAVMGVSNEIGADGAPSGAPSISWIAGSIKSEPITRQPSDGHAIEVEVQRWNVTVRGSDFGAAEELRRKFKVALAYLFGADGYGQKQLSCAPSGDRPSSTDFAWELALELRVPVYDKVFIHAQLPLSGQATGSVTADGTTTEPLS